MAEITIRAPSLEALFDPWSPARLEARPLSEEARTEILERWSERRRDADPGRPVLNVLLPSEDQREGVEERVSRAVSEDLQRMRVLSKRHWIRRSFRTRQTRIGLLAFFIALAIAGLINLGGDGDSGEDLLAQTFVVFAWVALWQPAQHFFNAASFRLARKYFTELGEAEVRVLWD